MPHRFKGASAFDPRRQLAEPEVVTGSPHGATLLAENAMGFPLGGVRAIGPWWAHDLDSFIEWLAAQ